MLLHVSFAFSVLHALPHFPQLLVVVIAVSQPPTFALQSAKPALHLMVQVPPTQLPTPLVWLHTLPQLPQLFASFVRLTSQPFAMLLSQFAKSVLQVIEQVDAMQVAVSLLVLHAFPQPPQLSGSVVMWVAQVLELLQSAKPVSQWLTAQVPPIQTSDPVLIEHALPHDPQLLVSVLMSSSQPFAAFLSQSA